MTREDLLRETYGAFAARDIDRVLRHLAPDVDWPNAWEGGRLHGREAVRAYWLRQWEQIDPSVEPEAFEPRGDDAVAVRVRQVVRDPAGALIGEGTVVHVYVFRDELIARMDVEEAVA